MPEKISLDWSKKADIERVSFPRDTLNRAKYAEFLTQFLVGQGFDETREKDDQKRNYVLNLNSEWGSGKTYFLKRWSHDLKAHFPVVYIDAWQQDYSDDPLMTVISSVIQQLRTQAGMEEDNPEFKLPRKLIGLLKAAAPGLARSIAKRYFDIDPVLVMQEDQEAKLGNVENENGESVDMGELASSMVKHLIDEHDAKHIAIKNLKENVANWVSCVTNVSKRRYPAFIFIDELDRCRPSYAVEMLETIKHIFDIKGIVFVVATDTEQLQHAVKAIYGEGFDARLYLGRFFNSRFSLKAPDLKSFLEVHTDISKLSGEYLTSEGIQILPPNDDEKVTLSNISVILHAFKMPPRTAIQIADRVVATISNMPKGAKIDILMLTTLLCFYEENNELFRKVVSGKLEYKDNQDKDLGLNGYIENRFENCESIIEMHTNPKTHMPLIPMSGRSPRSNPFGSDSYKILFKEYLNDCFLEGFGNKKTFLFMILGDSTQEETSPIGKLSDQLFSKPLSPIESGLLWFKILSHHYDFVSISPETYQDYVELASALDLIEESDNDN